MDNVREEYGWDFIPPEQHFDSPMALVGAFKHYQVTGLEDWELSPKISAPRGKFEIVAESEDPHAKRYLWPTAGTYAYLFRGQGEFFNPCLPTLYRREKSAEEIFINSIRISEFRLMLKQYPQVKFFEEQNLNIDYLGLAQHYGLETNVLDLTSSIDVALFFAMCEYNGDSHMYQPKSDNTKQYIGYLYAFPFILSLMGYEQDIQRKARVVKPIGLQPFPRPGAQRGFSIHIEKGGEFTAPVYSFSYTAEDSQLIFNRYNDIFIDDNLSEAARRIANSTTLFIDAIKLACARNSYSILGKKISYNKAYMLLKQHSIQVTANPMWQLSQDTRDKLTSDFNKSGKRELISTLVQRRLRCGENEYPYINMSHIVSRELIRLLKLGCKSLAGYDSGITLLSENNGNICSIGYNMGRKQTIPNSITGKIDKWNNLSWNEYILPNADNRFKGNFPKEQLVFTPKKR